MRRFVSSTFNALTLMVVGLMLAGCGSGGGSGGETSSQVLSDNTSVGAPQSSPTNSTSVSKQLALAWDPVAGATSYNLYWSTAPGVTTASGTKISGVVSSSYVHTGLAAGTKYYYVVTAVNSSSESAASISASGSTPS